MTAAQLAEYKKIKAELREARTGGSTSKIKRRPSSTAGDSGEEHDTRTPLRQGRQPPRNPSGCATVRVVSHSGLLHPGATGGVSDIPQSAVKELANCRDVSSSHEFRTNPPVIDGSTKPWNAGGIATSPEGRYADSCNPAGLTGVSHPAPRPTTTGACCRPDRKEASQQMHQFRKPDGRPSPTRPLPGKDSCTRQAVTGLLCSQEGLLATP